MFNDKLADDTAIFALARYGERERIVFTTVATLKAKTPGKTPLWWFEPRSEDELASISVWLGERRKLWPAWRALSERLGIQALADEIGRLWSLEPIETCQSLMLSPGDDDRGISLYAKLVTRSSELVRHRFASVERRRVFTEWYLRDIAAHSSLLFVDGCLIGPKHLARVLDRIASAEIRARRAASSRRAARPRRKAA